MKSEEIILFSVGDTICGIPLKEVQEIKKVSVITHVYGAPKLVLGVINLRGQIVSVLDMRIRFGLEKQPISGSENIMILPWNGEIVGVLVDAVDDVVLVDKSQLMAVPSNIDSDKRTLFEAVYQLGDIIVSIVRKKEILNSNLFKETSL